MPSSSQMSNPRDSFSRHPEILLAILYRLISIPLGDLIRRSDPPNTNVFHCGLTPVKTVVIT